MTHPPSPFHALLALLVLPSLVSAQHATVVPLEVFKGLTVGAQATVGEIVPPEGHASLDDVVEEIGGAPDRACTSHPAGQDCTISWPGLELLVEKLYPEWDVRRIRITSDAWEVLHDDVPLHVGSPLTNLEASFPEAYDARKPICRPDLGCRDAVSIRAEEWEVTMAFFFDPETERVTEVMIEVFY